MFRALRRATFGLSVTLAVVGLSLLGAGLALDDIRLWNLGCTVILTAFFVGGSALALYVGEINARDHEEIKHRLDGIEKGERAICESVVSDLDRWRRQA